ncbi:hypothetical protein [Dyella sp.]|uniref:hypothetical protein n=1 Tax=Dyella sp. TaxID=1869338 RepID=UPI002D78C221|nr:hypothetical protein [Dyella sp.]HET7331942.1 hypothetical protein [Dyella sp.]
MSLHYFRGKLPRSPPITDVGPRWKTSAPERWCGSLIADITIGKPARFGRCTSVAIIARSHAVVSMQRKKARVAIDYTKFLCALCSMKKA